MSVNGFVVTRASRGGSVTVDRQQTVSAMRFCPGAAGEGCSTRIANERTLCGSCMRQAQRLNPETPRTHREESR